MVKGTSPEGEHYYPAFPYTSYQRIGSSDLRDLFAYLKTLPAVQDKSKPHDVPFPFNIRRAARRLEIPVPRRQAVRGRSDQGRRLESRRLSRQRPRPLRRVPFAAQFPRRHHQPSQRFAGGPEPTGDGFVPNITRRA